MINKETWSASEQAQRRRLIKILPEMIDDLSAETPAEVPVKTSAASKSERRQATKSARQTSSSGRRAARRGTPRRRRLLASGRRRYR
jgi:hypothetical protein